MNKRNEIINYLIFGVLTTAVNIISFWVINRLIEMDYRMATSIAWVLSVLFAFVTNKLYVFNSKKSNFSSVMREFMSFLFFRLLSYLLDLFTMILLVEIFLVDSLLAKIVANVFVVIFNYFASKFIIFKPSKEVIEK
ncbi:GtrA family protein [Niallia endozanthoxylica]|uniref:GtrA family protein n=1 Tax=Niallia endozanthoxylica TaxID=2036016 RepID=A0A5J5H2M0_9BACI|nr:GtrA family protein [Niallia endozanthoxylica]KAA9014537.1 GtrA family protein [Niallia endozanthoxylica]